MVADAPAGETRMDAHEPRCPECGEPIGATATYCIHCSTDLTDERARADVDGDGYWEGRSSKDGTAGDSARWLDPAGTIDDSLTAIVGICGGLVVGVVGTFVLSVVTASEWAILLGILLWIGVTIHLARRGTVGEALARTAYAVAIVLVSIPLIAFGPSSEGTDFATRVILFVTMLGAVAIPAAILAGVGILITRVTTTPDEDR